MSERPSDLPDFEQPPISEVLLSIQFERLEALTSPHLGILWNNFRTEFPNVEEHAQLAPAFERFEAVQPAAPSVRYESLGTPPLRRAWFLNGKETELIQIQSDRLIHNWRKIQDADSYPRYEQIRDHFVGEAKLFQSFITQEGLGELVVNQCEVTYVNHIMAGEVGEGHAELQNIISNWRKEEYRFLPAPENASLALRFLIRNEADETIGRLHAQVQPAWRNVDKRPMYVMTLTARGIPMGEGLDGSLRFFDVGREWIVRGFADLTTTKMHELWRRLDG